MIIPIKSDDPSGWLPSDSESSAPIDLVLTVLKRHCVTHTPELDLVTLVKLLRDADRGEGTRSICEVLARIGIARAGSRAHAQVEVGSESTSCPEWISSIYQITETKSCIRVLDSNHGARTGESREEICAKHLEPFALRASRAVIYDRYCAKDLLDRKDRSGTAWLIRQLLEDGLPSIDVVTANGSTRQAAATRKLAEELFPSSVCFKIGPQSVASHDRHIRFQFGVNRTAMAVGIAAGLDNVFGRERTQQVFDIYPVVAGRAREREIDLAKAAERWSAP